MHKRRRVAILCQHFYPEMISTGMHMTELAVGLARTGWRVTAYCAQPSLSLEHKNEKAPPTGEYEGVSIRRVKTIGSYAGGIFRRLTFSVSYVLATMAVVVRERRQIDLLLITTNPPFLGLVGVIATVFLRVPYGIIVYDVYPEIAVRLGLLEDGSLGARAWDWVTKLILRRACRVVVIGRDMLEIVAPKLGAGKREALRFIPNWSDERVVRPIPRSENMFRQRHASEDTLVVQYSGRMARTHNLEALLEAAEICSNKPVLFQFVGDGAKKKALMQTAEARSLQNVQFLGYRTTSELAEALGAADVAVVCLTGQFLGLSVPSKLYGIMASGTPVLGLVPLESEVGRVIQESECGWVMPDGTGAELAALIERLLARPGERKQFGNNARAAFLKDYTLTQAAARYARVLDEIAADCTAPQPSMRQATGG